jgi:hypothetical protein
MSTFNIACFISSTVIFFQKNHNIMGNGSSNGPNFVVLAFALIAYGYCYVMFWIDPYIFDYFKNSFRK